MPEREQFQRLRTNKCGMGAPLVIISTSFPLGRRANVSWGRHTVVPRVCEMLALVQHGASPFCRPQVMLQQHGNQGQGTRGR